MNNPVNFMSARRWGIIRILVVVVALVFLSYTLTTRFRIFSRAEKNIQIERLSRHGHLNFKREELIRLHHLKRIRERIKKDRNDKLKNALTSPKDYNRNQVIFTTPNPLLTTAKAPILTTMKVEEFTTLKLPNLTNHPYVPTTRIQKADMATMPQLQTKRYLVISINQPSERNSEKKKLPDVPGIKTVLETERNMSKLGKISNQSRLSSNAGKDLKKGVQVKSVEHDFRFGKRAKRKAITIKDRVKTRRTTQRPSYLQRKPRRNQIHPKENVGLNSQGKEGKHLETLEKSSNSKLSGAINKINSGSVLKTKNRRQNVSLNSRNQINWSKILHFVPQIGDSGDCSQVFRNTGSARKKLPDTYKNFLQKYKAEIVKWEQYFHTKAHLPRNYTEQVLVYQDLTKHDFVTTVCLTGFGAGFNALTWLTAKDNLVVYAFDSGKDNRFTKVMARFLKGTFPNRLRMYYGTPETSIGRWVKLGHRCDVITVDGSPSHEQLLSIMTGIKMAASPKHILITENIFASSVKDETWHEMIAKKEIAERFWCRRTDGFKELYNFAIGQYI